MSSGFEVRALTMDRNRLKRLRTNEDEEIFTIQVSKSVFSMHGMTIINRVIPTPIQKTKKIKRKQQNIGFLIAEDCPEHRTCTALS